MSLPTPSRDTIDAYFTLRQPALDAVRQYDLSGKSYDQLFARLEPLDDFLRSQLGRPDDQLEEAFHAYALTLTGRQEAAPATISGLLQHAASVALGAPDNLENLLARLAKGGAQIQPVIGALVLSDHHPVDPRHDTPRTAMAAPRLAPKTHTLIALLQQLGIHADDLFIYRGTVGNHHWRQKPYVLINIPRLNRQIAICDQMGQTTFFATQIFDYAMWASETKSALKAMPEIAALPYDAQWQTRLTALLQNAPIGAKQKLQSLAPHALLTRSAIAEWVKAHHERTGQWPRHRDKAVYVKQGDAWVENGEHWSSIHGALTNGYRGLPPGGSLTQLRNDFGLNDNISEARIEQLIRWEHERTGKWPSHKDRDVYEKITHEDGRSEWRLTTETWGALETALFKGARGLPAGSSLARFKEARGLNDDFTVARIHDLIKWTHEKTGEWPNTNTPAIYEKITHADGRVEYRQLKDEIWRNIDFAFRSGARGLPQVGSLAIFKDTHGYNDDLCEADIRNFILWTHEKTGKWPSSRDSEAYEKIIRPDGDIQWQRLPVGWGAINSALHLGLKGLPGGSSLPDFKRRHGFNGPRMETAPPRLSHVATPARPNNSASANIAADAANP